jgi:methylaspartate mutase epsilon subunit
MSQIRTGHTVVLGGIGGDSHSVGLTILRQTLLLNGYQVTYLGTQTPLEEFFRSASLSNVMMLSSMDGHARHYLRDFPELRKQYQTSGVLWYLGGNLHIDSSPCQEKYFLEMGFDRVFTKFVDIKEVLGVLQRDLHEITPAVAFPALSAGLLPQPIRIAGKVADERLGLGEMEKMRHESLESWRTGYQARDLVDNAAFLCRQASFPATQRRVGLDYLPILVQPRSGVPLVDEQIRFFNAFKRAGARVLSYQVDSLTRNNNYRGAEEAIRESKRSGIATINGFPVINHGVPGLRRIISEVGVPLQTRHSTRDPRLLAEISYAGGVTSFEGGAICYNIPYYKDYPLDESIKVWQYVDRLTGLYYERFGIHLDREFFGTLTATLIPPCIAIAVNILEVLLAVRQGVKNFSLGYAEQGNRVQDIAAIRMLAQIANDVLHNLGYKDIRIRTVFHQYMAAFPPDYRRAEDLIYHSAITAKLSGATRIIIKTPVEAIRLPSIEDNIYSISLVQRAILDDRMWDVDEVQVAEECEVIRREVNAILESIVMCGSGNIADGIVAGFRKGYLDIPFSPSIHNRGEVMTVRDTQGAVRFLSTGNLQFDRELQEFHQCKVADRRRAKGITSPSQDYLLVEHDVLQIAREDYTRWPLHPHTPRNERREVVASGGETRLPGILPEMIVMAG